jgi:2,3-diaminopropionate biosynthesis protein SbnB
MSLGEVLYLSKKDVVEAGGSDMKLAMKAVEHVLECHAAVDYVLPSKSVVRWGDGASEMVTGRINCMPGYVGGPYKMAGIKWIGSQPDNVKRGLPRATAVVILNDAETKFPVAIMEGSVISAMRTGATQGVAAKYLSRRDSAKAGVIGAGVLSRAVLRSMVTARPSIREVFVYDLDKERAEGFARDMSGELGVGVTAVGSAEDAVRGLPIFSTATTTRTPIIKNEWVEKGSFYAQVGPYEAEVEVLLKSDKLVVDNLEEVLHRGTSTLCAAVKGGLYNKNDVYAELKDIVVGKLPGRENESERIFFKSVGMGLMDIAFATEIFRNAQSKKLGQKLPFVNA